MKISIFTFFSIASPHPHHVHHHCHEMKCKERVEKESKPKCEQQSAEIRPKVTSKKSPITEYAAIETTKKPETMAPISVPSKLEYSIYLIFYLILKHIKFFFSNFIYLKKLPAKNLQ